MRPRVHPSLRSGRSRLRVLVVAACAALPAGAQTTGRIEGRTVDAGGEPLAGASVTVTSPSLQGKRAAMTAGDGRFRLPGLQPGEYAVTARLEGYGPALVAGVRVSLDRTVTLELVLQPVFREEVTIRGAPLLDLTGTTSGTEFSEEVFQDLPTSRTRFYRGDAG